MRLQAALLPLLLCAAASPAVEPEVVDEIRSILQHHALVTPTSQQLASLSGEHLPEGLRAIDPWAEHIEPLRDEGAAGELGIGAELYAGNGRIWLMPFAGGAMMQAGVRDRMILLAVDGYPVEGRPMEQIAGLLQGPAGSQVTLELCPPDCAKSTQYRLARGEFRPSPVELLRFEDRPMIRIRNFVASETRLFLQSTLQALELSQPLLIDLRDCQGGDLFEAMDSAALFIEPRRLLLHLVGRGGSATGYRSPTGLKFRQPFRLLIGANTASSCEAFAGIVRIDGRAELLGQTTRGKCVSQTRTKLADGSQLHYTNLAIRFADGSSCDGNGLQPDRVVDAAMLDDSAKLMEWLDL